MAKYDTIEDQMPADTTREGYVFAGWYTDEAYTVPFVAAQQIVRNLTLHAKWTRTDSCTYVTVSYTPLDVYKRQDMANAWGIGSAEKNNGVLLLLSVGDDDYPVSYTHLLQRTRQDG